jgi:predicted phosphoribosyltransferase
LAKIVDDPVFRNALHVFNDRSHAGELLAHKLEEYGGKENVHILAIPAGGVQVARPIAIQLEIPLDLAITRKIHVPWNSEVGFGAISWEGVMFLNEPLIASLGLSREEIDRCVAAEQAVIARRQKKFRGDRPFPDLQDQTVIIVDDGLASGFSMLATLETLGRLEAKAKIVAVPTAPVSAVNLIRPHAEKVVCLNLRSGPFFAVADAYKRWYDLDDGDVLDVLRSLTSESP